MSGIPIESSGLPFDPQHILKLDMLPPQSGIESVINYEDNTVRFRPYYFTVDGSVFGPWTQDYYLSQTPIHLTWAGLWPRGNPLDN